jgi:hypothetical protein
MYFYFMKRGDEEKILFKQKIHEACLDVLRQRIYESSLAMQDAQNSANSEDKSSAGDKYETGRAMSQLARDMNARQLEEAKTALAQAEKLPVQQVYDRIVNGAVAICEGFTFFIGIGLGLKEIDGKQVILLSSSAPLMHELLNKKAGDSIFFKGEKRILKEVF